jgi:hypothetical protein
MAEKVKELLKGHHLHYEEDIHSVVGLGIGHTSEFSPYGSMDMRNSLLSNAMDSITLRNEESDVQLRMGKEVLTDHHNAQQYELQTIEVSDNEEEIHFPHRENTLICALAETVQHPPIGPFQREDLIWKAHRTSSRGVHQDSEIAVIPWIRLQDFVVGEQNNENFPCKFIKETLKVNKLGTLLQPRANSGSIVIR